MDTYCLVLTRIDVSGKYKWMDHQNNAVRRYELFYLKKIDGWECNIVIHIYPNSMYFALILSDAVRVVLETSALLNIGGIVWVGEFEMTCVRNQDTWMRLNKPAGAYLTRNRITLRRDAQSPSLFQILSHTCDLVPRADVMHPEFDEMQC